MSNFRDLLFFRSYTNFVFARIEEFSIGYWILFHFKDRPSLRHTFCLEREPIYICLCINTVWVSSHTTTSVNDWNDVASAYNNWEHHLKPVTQTVLSIFVPLGGRSSLVRVCLKSSRALWLVRVPPIVNLPQLVLQMYHTQSAIRCLSQPRQSPLLIDSVIVLLCTFPLTRV